MADWLDKAFFPEGLDFEARQFLAALKPQHVPRKTVLFRPGDEAGGFVIVLSGRVGVYLTGRSGRELLLYSVAPGETCVLTTLSILGGEPYQGEGIAESDLVAVMVPASAFRTLMTSSALFSRYVFKAFAARMADVMFLLEQVAFVRVEARLANVLLERMDGEGKVTATHGELAAAIGSAREVVSRRLEALSSKGIVSVERGHVLIEDADALARAADER